MIKIQSTTQPTSRNSVKSDFDKEKHQIKIVPREVGCKIIPLGTAIKFWDNFNLELYRKLSLIRATADETGNEQHPYSQ